MTNTPPHNSIAQTNKSPKTAIHSLYVLKAICAFIVVMIHIPPLGVSEYKSILTPFDLISVPLFLMITGYFLYHPDSKQVATRAKKAGMKALYATLSLNVIYLLPWLLRGSRIPIQSVDDLLLFITCGTNIEGVLWYMLALFYSMMIILGVCQIGLAKYLKYLLLLIPLGILCGRYAFLLGADKQLYNEFNALLALPYIILGYAIRKHEHKLLSYKWEIISFVSLLVACIEVYTLKAHFPGYWGRYILTPVLSLAIFMWCLQYKSWGLGTFTEKLGKEYAGNIYYFHMLVAFGLRGISKVFSINIFYQDLGVLYVFAISLVVAMISVGIQKRLGISWLR